VRFEGHGLRLGSSPGYFAFIQAGHVLRPVSWFSRSQAKSHFDLNPWTPFFGLLAPRARHFPHAFLFLSSCASHNEPPCVLSALSDRVLALFTHCPPFIVSKITSTIHMRQQVSVGHQNKRGELNVAGILYKMLGIGVSLSK